MPLAEKGRVKMELTVDGPAELEGLWYSDYAASHFTNCWLLPTTYLPCIRKRGSIGTSGLLTRGVLN